MSTLKVNAITETDGSAFPFGVKVLQVAQTTFDPGSNNYASTSATPSASGLITTITPSGCW